MIGGVSIVSSTSQSGSVNNDSAKKASVFASSRAAGSAQQTDRLELSNEALRILSESQGGTPSVKGSVANAEQIREKIASGFYNSPGVQRAVASKINSLLPAIDK